MKNCFRLMIGAVLFCSTLTFSDLKAQQVPQTLTYQSVLRNSSNVLMANTAVGIKISILHGSASGSEIFSETQAATTNANGLLSLQIGAGSAVNGTFANIDWANGPYFIKTETDPTGGSNYSIVGTQQLASVPYALYAAKSGGNVFETTADDPNAIHNINSGNVGIGTDLPGEKLDVAGNVLVRQNQIVQGNSTVGQNLTVYGNLLFPGGQPNQGKVLTSDMLGYATWQTPAAPDLSGLATTTDLNNLQNQVDIQSTINQVQQNQINDLNAVNQTQDQSISNLSSQVQSNTNNISNLQVENNQQAVQISDLNTGLTNTYNQVQSNTNNISNLQVENDQQAIQISDLNTGLTNTYNQVQSNSNNISNLQVENDQQAIQISNLNTVLTNTQSQVQINTTDNINQQTQIDNMSTQNAMQDQSIMNLSAQVQLNTTDNVNQQTQIDNMSTQNAMQDQSIMNLDFQVLSNTTDITNLQSQISNVQSNFVTTADDPNAIHNVNSGNVGIGTDLPGEKLDVAGNVLVRQNATVEGNNMTLGNSMVGQNLEVNGTAYLNNVTIPSGNPAQGKVLTSDNNGIATWQTPVTVSITSIANTSNVNGGTIDAGVLSLAPADASNGGVVTTEDQTFAGAKTFSSDIIINGINAGGGGGGASVKFGAGALAINYGSTNSAFGTAAMQNNTSGYDNTAVGWNANSANTTGAGNTAIGVRSLEGNSVGSNLTAIGHIASVGSPALVNATAIGAYATVNNSNQIQLGNGNVTSVNTSGTYTGAGFVKAGGTSSEYLMADGTTSAGPDLSGLATTTDLNNLQNQVNVQNDLQDQNISNLNSQMNDQSTINQIQQTQITNLNAVNQTQDQNIITLNSQIFDQTTLIQNQQNQITNLDTVNQTQDLIQQTQINNINTINATQDQNIITLTSQIFDQATINQVQQNQITDLNAVNATQDQSISNLGTQVQNNTTDITNLQSQISNVQPKFVPASNPNDITNVNYGNVGIGTDTPTEKLDIKGGNLRVRQDVMVEGVANLNEVKISSGNPAQGKVLTSDNNGIATWQTPAAPDLSGYATTQDLNAETARAVLAEVNIQTDLDNERNRAEAVENYLQSSLDAETSRATAAEYNLETGLNAETNRAVLAEVNIQTSLDDETSRATAAENNLETGLNA
jgi:hypothetical protein